MDLKDTYTSVFLKAAGQPFDENIIKKFRSTWWQNVRAKDCGGLRLTDQGLEFVETHSQIKTYKVEILKEISITPQILVWLDQFIESPYHLTKKHIVVLREKSAFELYLFSGDVKKMGYAKAMHQRLSQES